MMVSKEKGVATNNTITFRTRVKTFIWLFIILLVLWLVLTGTFQYQELLTGIFISLIIAVFAGEFYLRLSFPPLSPKRFLYLLWYIIILFYEIIKANFDVARRVIHPALPINPGIVVIRTELTSDIAKTILANSITLTPGTFTLDIQEDKLLIHWIDVSATDIEETTRVIGGKFEKYLRIIFT
jgi:multicomponent Na+:H+ antiporter subunit E